MYPTKAIEAANSILQQRRYQARQDSMARREALYRQYPALRQYEDRLLLLTQSIALAVLDGSPAKTEAVLEEVQAVQAQRREYLTARDLAPDILEPRYTCPLCQDTGRVEGKRCRCLEALLRAESCRGLPSAAADGQCSFASFRLDYYPEAPDQTGRSPRSVMSGILQRCRDYADRFCRVLWPRQRQPPFPGPHGAWQNPPVPFHRRAGGQPGRRRPLLLGPGHCGPVRAGAL